MKVVAHPVIPDNTREVPDSKLDEWLQAGWLPVEPDWDTANAAFKAQKLPPATEE